MNSAQAEIEEALRASGIENATSIIGVVQELRRRAEHQRASGRVDLTRCREKSAQAWCFPETGSIEMDTRLAEAFARIMADDEKELLALLEQAWGLIANASGGEWSKESPDWQAAAARWRYNWRSLIHGGTAPPLGINLGSAHSVTVAPAPPPQMPETVLQLAQIAKGPVWDGNLASKSERDKLVEADWVIQSNGWNMLSLNGLKMCVLLGLLKS